MARSRAHAVQGKVREWHGVDERHDGRGREIIQSQRAGDEERPHRAVHDGQVRQGGLRRSERLLPLAATTRVPHLHAAREPPPAGVLVPREGRLPCPPGLLRHALADAIRVRCFGQAALQQDRDVLRRPPSALSRVAVDERAGGVQRHRDLARVDRAGRVLHLHHRDAFPRLRLQDGFEQPDDLRLPAR